MIKGIDVSVWQDKLPEVDYDFVIMRAGYGEHEDTLFRTHYKNAIKKNKRVGVYWYSYAYTDDQARAEARKCLEVIKGLNITMGVWFDSEEEKLLEEHGALNWASISNICNAFCEVTERAGYYSGIYGSYSKLKNYVRCPKYDKWVAYWGSNNGRIPANMESELRNMGASIWQYTSKLSGQNLDGDVLLHDDINMYNIKPKQTQEDLKAKLKAAVDYAIDQVITDYFKE